MSKVKSTTIVFASVNNELCYFILATVIVKGNVGLLKLVHGTVVLVVIN